MDEERVPTIPDSPAIKIRIKPEYYLQHAHQDLATGNRVKAIQNYICYIDNLSDMNDMKTVDQVNITKLLLSLTNTITDPTNSEQDEIMKCYTAVINKFPENVILLNAFGIFFYTQNEYVVAAYFLEKAAKLEYLPAEKNYLHVIWQLIPRWHFRMLNDRKRNESYRDAILKAIRAGFRDVYDIGTGCGLLSLIAAGEQKVNVTAIEENKIMYNLAAKVFEQNSANVKLIYANSTKLAEPPKPCNLLVTEIFDAALLGENCLKTMRHALATFVKTDKFQVIPAAATMYVTAFRSEQIAQKFRYIGTLPELMLANVCLVDADPGPYDCDFLKKRNLKYVSQTQGFLRIDFSDQKQLEALLTPEISCPDVELVCVDDGLVHGLAVWFDLSLDADIKISTSPFNSEIKCWEQAVFHLPHPVPKTKGSVLRVKPTLVDGQISFSPVGHISQCEKCFKVSGKVISILNDAKLVRMITKLVDSYGKYDVKVVDFNFFPLFGFLMAKRGAKVFHIYKDECDLEFYKHLMNINGLSSYKMIFIHIRAVQDSEVFVDPPDIVYTNYINRDGSWNGVEVEIETRTNSNCQLIPKKFILNAQLISSEYLNLCNRVDDNMALNFKMADYINEYTGTEHPHLASLSFEKHSTIVSFDISDLECLDFHQEADIVKDGSCNAILYWFDLQLSDDESITFSTIESSHYDKTCTLLKCPKNVTESDKVMVHVMRLDGHLKVYCDL